jgi:hypothetical protein
MHIAPVSGGPEFSPCFNAILNPVGLLFCNGIHVGRNLRNLLF